MKYHILHTGLSQDREPSEEQGNMVYEEQMKEINTLLWEQ